MRHRSLILSTSSLQKTCVDSKVLLWIRGDLPFSIFLELVVRKIAVLLKPLNYPFPDQLYLSCCHLYVAKLHFDNPRFLTCPVIPRHVDNHSVLGGWTWEFQKCEYVHLVLTELSAKVWKLFQYLFRGKWITAWSATLKNLKILIKGLPNISVHKYEELSCCWQDAGSILKVKENCFQAQRQKEARLSSRVKILALVSNNSKLKGVLPDRLKLF